MGSESDYIYTGGELDLFAHARVWKAYFASRLAHEVKGTVAEIGAGIGANTTVFKSFSAFDKWICLEPDAGSFKRLESALASLNDPRFSCHCATVSSLSPESVDTVLYLDVLEHIDNDREELHRASLALRPGGRLIVLAPAHASLYSEFDKKIGHYRRYSQEELLELHPTSCHLVQSYYLDSAGLLASLANKALLKQSLPTLKQIHFWDRILVRVSKLTDSLTAGKFGKSVIAVWEKQR